MRYRAELPLLVLAFRDNHHAAVPIPAGQEFELIGAAEDDRFVVIASGHEQFLVFATDVRDRAAPLPNKPPGREERRKPQRAAGSA